MLVDNENNPTDNQTFRYMASECDAKQTNCAVSFYDLYNDDTVVLTEEGRTITLILSDGRAFVFVYSGNE